ncbi:MAG TPA: hypothetical protein PLV01_01405 [Candidatus Kapabacteria bacterium]|nr:hypothetical protein [Candidatus Kapabacteria bacterium]
MSISLNYDKINIIVQEVNTTPQISKVMLNIHPLVVEVLPMQVVALSGGIGDMQKSNYDANNDNIVDKSEMVVRRYEAGEVLSAGVPVVLIDGKIYKAKASDVTHYNKVVGVTIQAGDVGTQLMVCIQGEVELNVIKGNTYWLAEDGGLSTQPSEVGFAQIIGFGERDNYLYINVQQAIRREQ